MPDHTQEILNFINSNIASIRFELEERDLQVCSDEPGFRWTGFPAEGFAPRDALQNFGQDLEEQLVHWLVGRLSKNLKNVLRASAEAVTGCRPGLQLWTGLNVHKATVRALRAWRLVHENEWSDYNGASLTPLGSAVARELILREKAKEKP